MIKNYISQEDLKAYIPNIDNLLWTGQEDFSTQFTSAEIEVMNDFIKKNYKAIYLRNDLFIREAGTVTTAAETSDISEEDTITRMRFVVDCKTFTGDDDKVITIHGTNDSVTYTSIDSLTISATGVSSLIISQYYKHYKVVATVPDGSIDYAAYLTETSYDLLYIYKTLIIILTPLVKEENSTYGLLLAEFKRKYENEWNELKVFYDSSESGDINGLEIIRNSSINYLK